MVWVSLFALIILVLSFVGGLKEGAVKHTSNLVITLIAIPLAGISYHLVATILSFLPGENWENFFGFFITLAIISAILHLIAFLPRRLVQKIWKKGLLFRLLGGALNTFNASIGMVVFTLVLTTQSYLYPWVESEVSI